MGNALDVAVVKLLACSLEAWGVNGDVLQEADGSMLVISDAKRLRISRAPAGLPFRWMVTEGERERGATAIAGLLRALRAALDPGYRPVRLRVAPLPLAAT